MTDDDKAAIARAAYCLGAWRDWVHDFESHHSESRHEHHKRFYEARELITDDDVARLRRLYQGSEGEASVVELT